jgi:hypothetical protein
MGRLRSPRFMLSIGLPLLSIFSLIVLLLTWEPPAQSNGQLYIARADPLRPTLSLRDTPVRREPAFQAPTNLVEHLETSERAMLEDADGQSAVTAVQSAMLTSTVPTPVMRFPGMALPEGSMTTPPDTMGEVGRDYYIQAVNARLQVFLRDGTPIVDPIPLGTVWDALGLPCAQSHGDPSVLYDQFAARWLLAQTVFASETTFGVCLALSTSEDPLGTYTLYYYPFEGNVIYDLPLFGIWHDGYYMTVNRWSDSWSPMGGAVVAFERDAMLVGVSAQAVVLPTQRTMLVTPDAEGMTLPTTAPVVFAMRGTTALSVWRAFINWDAPTTSSLIAMPDITIAEHDYLCDGCVVQPETTRRLGARSNALSHDGVYRDFGGYDAVILSHATNVHTGAGIDRPAVRWYEIRGIKSGQYTVYQESTFAPADGLSRWMPAAGLDRYGNLLVQYTVSSETVYPGIRYSGRAATDPLNTLQQEVSLMEGSGSQTGSGRWGDYATMSIDPLDDCTFWFSHQYVAETRAESWATYVGAVRFPECIPSITPTPQPSPTATATLAPAPSTPTPTATEGLPPQTPTVIVSVTPTLDATPTETPLPSPTATVATSTPLPLPPETTPRTYPLYLPMIRTP